MSHSHQVWEKKASDALSKALGKEQWDSIVGPLRHHEASDKPVLTIFGAYDSGKSTLLKRLLVDDGKPIPPWLTISARRETFESQEVDLSWARLRDTPGLAGGNPEHDRIAREALMLSDAVLLVLPPQLLTGERERIVEMLRGAESASIAELPLRKEGLFIAIARMDEAGTDPAENPAGYKDLCDRKIAELHGQFDRARVQIHDSHVVCVSADPYQQVGNRNGVTRADYDEFRPWDGVERLRDCLSSLGRDLEVLRGHARIRYLATLAASTHANLTRRKEEVGVARAECVNGRERLALIAKQHEGLVAAAKADLDGVVNEQLRSTALAGLGSTSEVIQMVEPRMNKAFEAWFAKHDAALQKLVREANAELQARAKRPGARKLGAALKPTEEKEPAEKPRRPDIGRIGKSLEKALRLYHESKIGMTLAKAEEELKKLSNFPTFEAYREAAKGRDVLKTLDHADKAKRAVGIHRSLEILAPVVVELGSLLLEEISKREAAKERAHRREQLQGTLREAASKIACEFWNDFEGQGTDFARWIEEQEKPLEHALAALEAEDKTLAAVIGDLEQLVRGAPWPSSDKS